MKTILWSMAGIAVAVGGFFVLNNYIYMEKQGETSADGAKSIGGRNIQIIPISHATAIVQWDDVAIYADPTGGAKAFVGQPAANIVLVTDIHGDHLSTSTLSSVVGPTTSLIVPQAVLEKLPAELAARARVLKNDESLTQMNFKITAIPMYNLPTAENRDFHTKGRGNGYVIERDGKRVYIAGDTAGIPEMRTLTNIDIALVPMNLPYTMDVAEAADAVLAFKPKQVYPYHYRGPDGLSDIAKFQELVNAGDPAIEVVLLDWYK
jgi:L-ascorbate metabolism protein UlaG (beta-lactamase superfamily)